jgi:hypothetical protein
MHTVGAAFVISLLNYKEGESLHGKIFNLAMNMIIIEAPSLLNIKKNDYNITAGLFVIHINNKTKVVMH